MKNNKMLICKECGAIVHNPLLQEAILMSYLEHPDGTIFCVPCFRKLQAEGKIK